VDIRLGRMADSFELDATQLLNKPVNTQLVLGGGDDQVSVKSTLAETNILGGAGSDTVIVSNDRQTTDEIIADLHFDGNRTLVEQSSGIVYHGPTHDAVIQNVPWVYTNTAGGTPSVPIAQFKEPILTGSRTAHVTVLQPPAVGSLSAGITQLNRSLAQYWTAADLTLTGTVAESDIWTFRLNGVDYTYQVQAADVQATDPLGAVALGLKNALSTGSYIINLSNRTINVKQGSATPFTAQVLNGLSDVATVDGILYTDFTQFELKGPVVAGDTWRITLGGELYEHIALSTDTLQTIAAALRDKINLAMDATYSAEVNRYLDIYVADIDPFTGKPYEDTIQRRGVQELGYIETGFQLYGYAMMGYAQLGYEDASGQIVLDQDNTSGIAQMLYEDDPGSLTATATGKPAIILDQTNASGYAVPLYENVFANLTVENSGFQVVVVTDQDVAGSAPLWIAENGSLTTTDTGVQALQISQSKRTSVPLYRDGDAITTLTKATRVTVSEIKTEYDAAVAVPIQYDLNGNKALTLPSLDANAVAQKGFQLRGYQQYGYFQNGGIKTTTNIGAGYTLQENFNDAFAVPLYIRTDSLGHTQITTENIEDATFLTINNVAAGNVVTLTDQWGRTFSETATGSSVRIVIPTNDIVAGRTWTANVNGAVSTYVAGANGDDLTSLKVAKGLALEIGNGGIYTADGEQAFTRPYIKYSDDHGSATLTVRDINADLVAIDRGTDVDQPLYLDGNGNLTTAVTSRATDWRGFQRTAGGLDLYLNQNHTLSSGSGYQQAVIVTNQLLYLDNNGNPTTKPTNNPQWIWNSAVTNLHDFNSDGTLSSPATLYSDADGNPTTRISNPSVVIDNDNQSGFALALYLDEYGDKTTQLTANKAYAATDDNNASLIWYDFEGLDIETGDPLPIPRVQDNDASAGTALYNAADHARASIEVDRLELIVGTRPFELNQSVLDTGVDTLIVDHSGTANTVTGTLDYDGATDTSTLMGLLPGTLIATGEALEAIEVRLGSQADIFTINSTNVTTTIRTNGGTDTVNIETAAGATHIFTGDEDDIVNIKNITGASQVHTGRNDDTINIGNANSKLRDIDASLTIHGDEDLDTINADNRLSTSNALNTADAGAGRVTTTQLSGLDMGGVINYFTSEDLNIFLGTGRDLFTIDSTHTNVTDITGNAGASADEFRVRNVAGATHIVTGAGEDTVTVGDNSHTLAGIQGILNVDAQDQTDILIMDNSGASTEQTGTLSDQRLDGFGMTGRIDYAHFEDVTLRLGSGGDHVTVDSTIAGETTIDTGAGTDGVKIETFDGKVDLATGTDSDTITLFDGIGDAMGDGAALEIDGGADGDTYIVTVASAISGGSFVNLKDSGGSGLDVLTYKGSSGSDLIQMDTVYDRDDDPDLEFSEDRWLDYGDHGQGLLISHFDDSAGAYQAADLENPDELMEINETKLTDASNFQVLNYATIEQVIIFAGAGNDKIISDDTAQQIDVFGNEGDDQFYVGSVLATELVLVEGREVAVVTQITHGASFEMNFYGGADDDYFEVNHNQADIALYGDNGDDTFFIKALLTLNEDEDLVELDNRLATVSGVAGEGSDASQKGDHDTRQVDVDALVYVENANVKIDGGAGFDAVAIVGTVLSDTFYVFTEMEDGETVQRIYGAGVKLRELLNIERIQIITGAGDDRVYIYGVDLGPVADMVINTGTGSDSVFVGGPELVFDLNFPTRSRTDYATVDGYQSAGEAQVAFGLGIDLTEHLDRVVPFDVVEPAHTRTKTVAAAPTLAGILNPVLLSDPQGLMDTIVFNNPAGPTSLSLEDRDLHRKKITTDATRVIYPISPSGSGTQTDLIAQLGSLLSTDADSVKEMVNDYLQNQIVFTDRYDDPDIYDDQGLIISKGLISRLDALSGTETVTIAGGISYAVFQETLDASGNIVTARMQLDEFLTGSGYTVNYETSPNPDPSKTDLLYGISSITNSAGNELAFDTQNREIIKDGIAHPDLIGVSLVTAAPVDLQVQPDYLKSWELVRSDQWNSLYVSDALPRIYFDAFEEAKLNLHQDQASTLTFDNDRFGGKTFVQGGDQDDQFEVFAIAGQTFLRGGAGADTFTVGQGTVDQIDSELFLLGEGGQDSVFVHSEGLAGSADVQLEKNTVQHTLEQDKLSKVTNALEFTIDDATENQLIGDQLESESVVYAQQAARATLADLHKVAVQAANELGFDIEAALQAVRTAFVNGIDGLVQEQQENLQSFVEGALVEYFAARRAQATFQQQYDNNITAQQVVVDAITNIIDYVKGQAEQQETSRFFSGFLGDLFNTTVTSTVRTPLTLDTVLAAYDAAGDRFVISLEVRQVVVTKVLGIPFTETTTATKTYTIAVAPDLAQAIESFPGLKVDSQELQGDIQENRLKAEGAKGLLIPYFTSAANTDYSLSNAELNAFYASAISGGDVGAAAVALIETNAGVQNALASIETEIIGQTGSNTVAALDAAIAKANALAIAVGDLDSKVDAVLADLGNLPVVLNAAADAADKWDAWVRLVRLQILPDVQFNNDTATLDRVKELWVAIADAADFTSAADFADLTKPTWQQALDLFDDADFIAVVDAYKMARELAKGFNNYKTEEYFDFRAVHRNILKFDTARQFLENGFDFETFKAAYKSNIGQLNSVLGLLDQLALESQYEAQLASLDADKRNVDAIVNRNSAVVDFFAELKAKAQERFTTVTGQLQSEYTFKIPWLFGITFSFTRDYSGDSRYLVANQGRDDAIRNFDEAVAESLTAINNQTSLDANFVRLNQDLSDVRQIIATATTDLDELKQILDQQYKFLRNVSRVAIQVLSDTRAGQASAEFEDASSLIAEVLHYVNTYAVSDQPGSDTPNSNDFEPGPSGNSVKAITRESDFFEVLSLTGLNAYGIHADYASVEKFTLMTGDGADRIRVHDSLGQAASDVFLLTGAGDDRIILSNANQSLDDLVGNVHVDAQGGGHNLLVVDDAGDPDADPNVVISRSAITGLAPGAITYGATGGWFESLYDDQSQTFTSGVTIAGAAGGNTITIDSTRNNPAVIEVTTVNTGSGDDNVGILEADQRYLVVQGQSGDDIIDARATTSGVAVFGGEGAERILGGSGNDVLAGGDGDDHISGNAGDDVILGDKAVIRRDAGYVVQRIETADGDQGGVDDLHGNQGDDVILGGAGADTLSGDADTAEGVGALALAGTMALTAGTDIILGDNGVVVRRDGSGEVNDVYSLSSNVGGADIITGGDGDNIIIGGAMQDRITGGSGNEIILGDSGRVLRDQDEVVTLVKTDEDHLGAVDEIDGGAGSDVILGGAGGDMISAMLGDNIILGDAGEVHLNNPGANDIFTTSPALGGIDTITGGGDSRNIIIGGALGDRISGGIGNDTILGDGGRISRDAAGTVTRVETIDDATGGSDTISGGDGADVILGGAAGDEISASLGGDIILGDAGVANLLGDVFTTSPTVGGDDQITGGLAAGAANRSIIIGGAGSDVLSGGNGDNVLVGDGGRVIRQDGLVEKVQTIDPATGGRDTITSGSGNDIIIGGAKDDVITAGEGSVLILGDNGEVNLNQPDTNDIFTINPDIGGDDKITGGSGTTIIVGGFGADRITSGSGDAVILGDNGVLRRNGAEVVTQVRTTDDNAATGGADIITSEAGTNVILGGVAGDIIKAPGGDNIILGDNGQVNLNGSANDVFTTEPELGGADVITGGSGDNIILGGARGDEILGGIGNDVILGDNGRVARDAANTVTRIETSDPRSGAGDTISGGGGDDIIVGGSGHDRIEGGFDNDILIGDHAALTFNSAPVVTLTFTGPADGSGDDYYHFADGWGDDVIYEAVIPGSWDTLDFAAVTTDLTVHFALDTILISDPSTLPWIPF
jgi:Ca2+-binding RTX toxin-like protein